MFLINLRRFSFHLKVEVDNLDNYRKLIRVFKKHYILILITILLTNYN